MPEFSTLVDLIRHRARESPCDSAYSFQNAQGEQVSLSYAALERRAQAIGARLQEMAEPGSRVLLMLPPGLEYIEGLFGSVLAGLVPVPAYPPEHSRIRQTVPRLRGVVRDAEPKIGLTVASTIESAGSLMEHAPELRGMEWLAPEHVADAAATRWNDPRCAPDDAALIQYTSGSTGFPRGVVLSHRNLLHNSAMIAERVEHGAESRGVIWLPPYHDLGLIGGILQPLFLGARILLMAPVTFLKNPLVWLRAISEFRGTTSGAPPFAFDLCSRRASPKDVASLDLTCWEVAFCGAEPIRASVLERFVDTFRPAGFRREALYPCYGLAEATLLVAGGTKHCAPVTRLFDAEALKSGRVVTSGSSTSGQSLVGCGQPAGDQRVIIVDPDHYRRCRPGEVGEIWVSGPSVGKGYWKDASATDATFSARLADTGDGPFLRTGDLGFLDGDQLFVAGRLKDLIIVGGKNYYPQDIEAVSEASHSALREGSCAAFSVPGASGEELVVAAELHGTPGQTEREAIVSSIQKSVLVHHDVRVNHVVLLERGTIPKTPSGKIRRAAYRDQFLRSQTDEKLSQWLYAVQWRATDRSGTSRRDSDGLRGTQWLVLADQRGVGDRLVTLLIAAGAHCVRIAHPLGRLVASDNPTAPNPVRDGLRDVIGKAVAGGSGEFRVVYLWSLDARSRHVDGETHAADLDDLTVGSPLTLLKILCRDVSIDSSIWFVTAGAQPAGATARLAIPQAALWGLGTAIAFEHPELRTKRIDLDEDVVCDDPAKAAEQLLDEVFANDREDQVALRGSVRYVPRLVPESREAGLVTMVDSRDVFTPQKTYVITGAFGFIGLEAAAWMVRCGARHLVLVGRHAPSEDAKVAISALITRGAEVTLHQADVSQAHEVANLVTDLENVRPLGGVLHLAGTFDDSDLLDLEQARLTDVMAARAHGAWNLHDHTKLSHELDFFIMFSSAVAVLGSGGQGAYAASNAVLDSLAHHRHACGLPGLTVDWGLWGEPDLSSADVVTTISPTDGFALLARLLRRDAPQVVVIPFNLQDFLRFYPRAGSMQIFADILREESRVKVDAYERRVLESEYVAPRTQTERIVAGIARRALAIDRIGARDSFIELGGDSVVAGGILARLGAVFGIEISLEDAFEALTVEKLAALIESRLRAEIEGLSEQEAAAISEEGGDR